MRLCDLINWDYLHVPTLYVQHNDFEGLSRFLSSSEPAEPKSD